MAVLISILALRLELKELISSLFGANYLCLIPAIIVYFASLYLRSYRWQFLLNPFCSISTKRLYPVIIVGYMSNNILPVRLGEIVRCYYLAQRENVRFSTTFATVIIERVFDGITLLFFLMIAAIFMPVGGLTERLGETLQISNLLVVVALVVPFVSALIAIICAALFPISFRNTSNYLTRKLPWGLGIKSDALVTNFLYGFGQFNRPLHLGKVFVLSLPIWLTEGSAYYFIALGFDLGVHFDTVLLFGLAILMVTAVSNLATAIPSSQGSIGLFEIFAVITLEALGVATITAGAYVLVLHATLLLPVTIIGLIYLLKNNVSLRALTRSANTTVT